MVLICSSLMVIGLESTAATAIDSATRVAVTGAPRSSAVECRVAHHRAQA
jgi:hypothetical protein